MRKKLFVFALMLCGVTAAWAQLSSPYEGSALPDNSITTYYLYNPASGLWLENNTRITSEWHTKGQLGYRGIPFIIYRNAGNDFVIESTFTPKINPDNFYLDAPENLMGIWALEPVTIGNVHHGYTLTGIRDEQSMWGSESYNHPFPSNNSYTAGRESNYYLSKYNLNDETRVWQLVTEEERISKMKNSNVPVDATWLIGSPDFANNDTRLSMWTNYKGGGNNGKGGDEDNDNSRGSNVFESWDSYRINFYQDLEVPNGVYRLTVQGYYRDGSREDVVDRRNDGTETIRAYYYANDEKHPFMSILDEAKTEYNELGFETETFGWWFPDAMTQAARAINCMNAYCNPEIEVTVTDGKLRIGVLKEEGSYHDWTIFDNWKLTLVASAEALAAREQLQQTINYVKAHSSISTTAAENVYENATSVQELQDAQKLLVAQLKQAVADRSEMPTIFETGMADKRVGEKSDGYGKAVTEHDKGFYLYNVGTGRWFCGGDDWGAHAAVGFPGIKVTTPYDLYGSGKYNGIKTWLFNGNWDQGGKLDHNGYCDTNGNAWKFWTVDEAQGIYTISRNGDDKGNNSSNGNGTRNLLGFSTSTAMRVDTNKEGAYDPNNQWIFVTEAQRDAMAEAAMPQASLDHPVDLTYKIKMPGFNQRERTEGSNQNTDQLDWETNLINNRYSGRHMIFGRNENHADFCVDIYGGQLNNEFYLRQAIENLRAGLYRVKVQGFNRDCGNHANLARLVANGQSVVLRDRDTEPHLPWVASHAGTTFDAVEHFECGLYWNEVLCTVGEDGQLTLGVESPRVEGNHCFCFDNFRLEYVDPTSVSVTTNALGWATYAPSYDVLLPEPVEGNEIYYVVAQNVNVAANTLTTSSAYDVIAADKALPAASGILVKAPAGTEVTFPVSLAETQALEGNLLVGVTAPTAKPEGENAYIFTQVNDKVGFYKWDAGTLAANKCYLRLPNTAGAPTFFSLFEDEATAIESLTESLTGNAPLYNLAGQRVSKAVRGVYITNGKKVLK